MLFNTDSKVENYISSVSSVMKKFPELSREEAWQMVKTAVMEEQIDTLLSNLGSIESSIDAIMKAVYSCSDSIDNIRFE